jgi:2-methylcitrate dehydratase PrpD
VRLENGNVLRGASDYPRGNPENPVSTEGLEEKFLALVGSRFGSETAERALERFRSLEVCVDMARAFADILPGEISL